MLPLFSKTQIFVKMLQTIAHSGGLTQMEMCHVAFKGQQPNGQMPDIVQ
jgi:hypothetical protein